MKWMGQSLSDSTVRNVTMDLRKKKIASEKASKEKPTPIVSADQTTPSEGNGDATVSSSTGTGTAIEDTADVKA